MFRVFAKQTFFFLLLYLFRFSAPSKRCSPQKVLVWALHAISSYPFAKYFDGIVHGRRSQYIHGLDLLSQCSSRLRGHLRLLLIDLLCVPAFPWQALDISVANIDESNDAPPIWGSKGGDDTLHVDVGLLLSIRLHDKGVVDKDTYWACFTMDSASEVCALVYATGLGTDPAYFLCCVTQRALCPYCLSILQNGIFSSPACELHANPCFRV